VITAPVLLRPGVAREAGRWLLLEGPRGLPRAVDRESSSPSSSSSSPSPSSHERRAYFVVPASYAPEAGVLDRLAGGGFVVEKRGLCTLRELVNITAEQEALLDVDVAVDLISRVGVAANDVFDAERVEICADGDVVAFAGDVRVDDARSIIDVLGLLLCDDADADAVVEALSVRHSRASLASFMRHARSWSVAAFARRLGEMVGGNVAPELVGAVVSRLFRDRLDAEREFDEQVAMLDDAALETLAERTRSTR
jgi:hypothetical protein